MRDRTLYTSKGEKLSLIRFVKAMHKQGLSNFVWYVLKLCYTNQAFTFEGVRYSIREDYEETIYNNAICIVLDSHGLLSAQRCDYRV